MKRYLKILGIFLVIIILSGCDLMRPKSENGIIRDTKRFFKNVFDIEFISELDKDESDSDYLLKMSADGYTFYVRSSYKCKDKIYR